MKKLRKILSKCVIAGRRITVKKKNTKKIYLKSVKAGNLKFKQ